MPNRWSRRRLLVALACTGSLAGCQGRPDDGATTGESTTRLSTRPPTASATPTATRPPSPTPTDTATATDEPTATDTDDPTTTPEPALSVEGTWRSFQRDVANTGALAADAPPTAPVEERWRAVTDEKTPGVHAAPVVADGTAYFASWDEQLYAIDVASGAVEWRYETGTTATQPLAYAHGAVFVGGDDGALHAVDAADGTRYWRTARDDDPTPPTVHENSVYVPETEAVTARAVADGHLQWRFHTGTRVRSPPAVAGGTVYAAEYTDAGRVYALDAADGSREWTASTGGKVRAAPTVHDGTVYVATEAGSLHALDAADGTERWTSRPAGGVAASPAVVGASGGAGGSSDGGTVFVGGLDEAFYALDAATGALRWTHGTDGIVLSDPLATPDTVFFGCSDGTFRALAATDGAVRWTLDVGQVVSSFAMVDGALFVGSGSTFYAFA